MHRTLSFLLCVLLLPIAGTAQVADTSRKELSIDEIFASSTFALKSLSSVQWLDEGRKFSYIQADSVTRVRNVYTYSVADGERELVMDGSLLVPKPGEAPMRIGSYQWSPDASSILVTGTLPARRTKSGGNFGIFSLSSKTFRLLTDTTAEQAIVQFAA
ncbi:MAG: dipeptidyl-peptidase-4, partial [Bacteroidetes bacterium]|nr:dipeptidyl-peptidase-4 [Bacteroidota bacterium]